MLNNEKVLIGARQTMRAIYHIKNGTSYWSRKHGSDRIDKVFIALDANSTITAPIIKECRKNRIEVESVPSKEELGMIMNIDVPCAVVSVLGTTDR